MPLFKIGAELRANAAPTFAPSDVIYLSRPCAKRLYKERMIGKRGAEVSYMLVGDGSVSEAELRHFSQLNLGACPIFKGLLKAF